MNFLRLPFNRSATYYEDCRKRGTAMCWLSNLRATKGSCIAIVAAFGMVNGPAWADGSREASLEATTHSLGATGLTNAQVLSDDELGQLRGGFLSWLRAFLERLPDDNVAIVQDGQNIDSEIGPGAVSAEILDPPRFEGTASADSNSASTRTISRVTRSTSTSRSYSRSRYWRR